MEHSENHDRGFLWGGLQAAGNECQSTYCKIVGPDESNETYMVFEQLAKRTLAIRFATGVSESGMKRRFVNRQFGKSLMRS